MCRNAIDFCVGFVFCNVAQLIYSNIFCGLVWFLKTKSVGAE